MRLDHSVLPRSIRHTRAEVMRQWIFTGRLIIILAGRGIDQRVKAEHRPAPRGPGVLLAARNSVLRGRQVIHDHVVLVFRRTLPPEVERRIEYLGICDLFEISPSLTLRPRSQHVPLRHLANESIRFH